MGNSRKFVAVSGCIAVLSCSSGLPPTAQRMTAAEVRATSVGKTSYGTGPRGDFVSYMAPDGVSRVRSGGFMDTGAYRIEEDGRVCTKYRSIRDGIDTCQTIYKDGTIYYSILPDGSVSGKILELRPGNTENL